MGAWVFFYCTPVKNLTLSLQSEILLPVEWNSYTKKCVCIAPPPLRIVSTLVDSGDIIALIKLGKSEY